MTPWPLPEFVDVVPAASHPLTPYQREARGFPGASRELRHLLQSLQIVGRAHREL